MTIARQIASEIEHGVRLGRELPFKLTLQGIAAHFGVSVMPARQATEQLVERRVLIQQPNGRLIPNERLKSPPAPKRPVAASADIFPDLVRFVLNKSLRGDEAFLREEETAERFGVGRTIMRQHFQHLSASGLIEHQPRRGWVVRTFGEKDMEDYISVRLLLESEALRLASPTLDRARLEQLLQNNSPTADGTPQLDNSLHRLWIETCNNRYISDFFFKQARYHMVLLEHAAFETAIISQVSAEHCTILRAILKRDLDSAETALREHILGQRPTLTELLRHIRK